jgi:hypothetical protein
MAPRRTRAKPVVFHNDYSLNDIDSVAPGKPKALPLPPAVEAKADTINVFTPLQLASLDSQQITELLNRQARAILGERTVTTETTLPFDGKLDNNPFVFALTQRVPANIYTPRNVYSYTPEGSVTFQPWFWRLAMTRALNVYLCDYMYANPHGPPFPLNDLKRLRRQHKNRGYQRNTRRRREAENK